MHTQCSKVVFYCVHQWQTGKSCHSASSSCHLPRIPSLLYMQEWLLSLDCLNGLDPFLRVYGTRWRPFALRVSYFFHTTQFKTLEANPSNMRLMSMVAVDWASNTMTFIALWTICSLVHILFITGNLQIPGYFHLQLWTFCKMLAVHRCASCSHCRARNY